MPFCYRLLPTGAHHGRGLPLKVVLAQIPNVFTIGEPPFAYQRHRQTPTPDRKTARKGFYCPRCKIVAIF